MRPLAATIGADSSGFSYASAETAFNSGTPPTTADLAHVWYLVESASNPEESGDLVGYWPNGKYQEPGLAGYFYNDVTVTVSTEASGQLIANWIERTYGAETNDVYFTVNETGAFSSTGLKFTSPGTNELCAFTTECRMVTAQAMLLCRRVTDDKVCNQRTFYVGYLQLNPAP